MQEGAEGKKKSQFSFCFFATFSRQLTFYLTWLLVLVLLLHDPHPPHLLRRRVAALQLRGVAFHDGDVILASKTLRKRIWNGILACVTNSSDRLGNNHHLLVLLGAKNSLVERRHFSKVLLLPSTIPHKNGFKMPRRRYVKSGRSW